MVSREPEVQILDYVTQQMKVFPEIATAIALKLAGQKLQDFYNRTADDMKFGKFDNLSEIHALSCALKALCTSDSAIGIERLRLACGGHGYLASSNLDSLYTSITASCTYEGDNTVLLLQVGRYLIKSLQRAMAGKAIAPTVAYLQKAAVSRWTGSWENILHVLESATAK